MEQLEQQSTQSYEPGSTARERISAQGKPGLVRAIAGVVMISICLGMGVLLSINFFDWKESWTWARIGSGVLFVVYGVWRAYRQFNNIDSSF